MIDRRQLLVGAAATAACPKASLAFENCSSPARALHQQGVEHALWFPIGPQDRDIVVYALVAPWCPNCRALSNDARAGKLPFSVRGIPVDPSDHVDRMKIATVLEAYSRGEVLDFFRRAWRPPSSQLNDWETDVLLGVQHTALFSNDNFYSRYPNLIRATPQMMGKLDYSSAPGFGLFSGYARDHPSFRQWIGRLRAYPTSEWGRGWSAYRAICETFKAFPSPTILYANVPMTWKNMPMHEAATVFCRERDGGYKFDGSVRFEGSRWAAGRVAGNPGFSIFADMSQLGT